MLKLCKGADKAPSASSNGTSFEDLKSSQGSNTTFGDEESPGQVAPKIQMSVLNVLLQVLTIWMHRLVLIDMTPFSKDPTAHIQDDDEVVSRVTFNSDGSIKEKVFTKVNDIKTTVKKSFCKADPNDPVASFKSEIPTFRFMKHVRNTELWHQLFPCVKTML